LMGEQVARFTILASGSSGNATLLEQDGFGLLIDCGLGPQVISERLGLIGRTWSNVSAVILTHTHSDHWNGLTLAQLRRLNIPLYAHPLHHDFLSASQHYGPLHRAKLTRNYLSQEILELGGALKCHVIPVPHDSDPTFGFRIEPHESLFGSAWAIGYASDVGHITPELLDGFSGVDTLAIEFNHDVRMQTNSGRPAMLIQRVLGPLGHLSNVDAAAFSKAIADSCGERFRHLIQLHLSKDCNTPAHALRAAKHVWNDKPSCTIVTASQFTPTEPLDLTSSSSGAPRTTRPARMSKKVQPTLPGFGPDDV
jgi:phosphoribosyl 1,2-cyclic phosphodiesterase